MAFRFEYDSGNKILLMRFEGRLTDESAKEVYRATRKYSIVTDPRAGIWDYSSATECTASSETVRDLARWEPAMPHADTRPRFIVAPTDFSYGMARMFQITGSEKRPLLQVVRSLDEALIALGIRSAHFEALM